MRIAFDTAPLARAYPPGVARACRGLVEALEARDDVEVVRLAPGEGESERAWRHLRLPGLAERAGALGVHSPVSAFAFRGPGRRVATVHELPWRHGVRENAGLSHRLWARFGVARADAVLCPSERVRADLLAESGGGATRVHACPWGVDLPPTSEPDERANLREVLGLVGVPYAVALGATRPKKDLAASVRALGLRLERGLPALTLLVTGPTTSQLERDRALAARLGVDLRPLGVLDDALLAPLLAEARVALVLSRSEGFGFPVLEALAHGTPVVVTGGSAQAEVAGAAGLAADPASAVSVTEAIERALAFEDAQRVALRERAASFPWSRCAAQVAELWERWA